MQGFLKNRDCKHKNQYQLTLRLNGFTKSIDILAKNIGSNAFGDIF